MVEWHQQGQNYCSLESWHPGKIVTSRTLEGTKACGINENCARFSAANEEPQGGGEGSGAER